jgi:hypothetical protein
MRNEKLKPDRLESLPGFAFLPNPIKIIHLSYWKAIFVIFASPAEALAKAGLWFAEVSTKASEPL